MLRVTYVSRNWTYTQRIVAKNLKKRDLNMHPTNANNIGYQNGPVVNV